ncbi:L-gulonolactone oxidase [Fusarium pseudocircinatum]|uniref:D-arabinono-1,4-lactone oxidase n=1 Tax=Fusarium pseudocircinatum TaxID=56676 RepID=A0A8H5NZB5_9HYPO|nr:L-gulonolactone oxidase [Fusarium pseudocircinatum]
MDLQDLSAADLVQKFDHDSTNTTLAEEIHRRTIDPSLNGELFQEIKNLKDSIEGVPRPPGDEFVRPRPGPKTSWENCIGQQKCTPKFLRYPKGLSDLVQAVKDGSEQKLNVRAVGSGHSFSNICPTDGILLDPHGMNKFLKLNSETLKEPSKASDHVLVESGITIKDLNSQLDKMGKALATMGAYDGQTLVGAITTGTHGSGKDSGNLASLVRAIILVSETGKVYQIEPKDGITDPAKFVPGDAQELKQDDDWFQAALISMSCLGLVYSYIIEVVPTFFLSEVRSLTTWQDYKTQLAGGLSSAPLQNHYFEIDLNPYATLGRNVAVTTIRTVSNATKREGGRGFDNWLAGLLAQHHWVEDILVWILNRWPLHSPGIITTAMKSLPVKHYIDKSFNVLNIGAVDDVKAYAMELSFDANKDIVSIVDRILALFQKAAAEKKWFLAGPFALRFVKESSAFLAPQQGRTTMMVEMDMLFGVKTGEELLKFMRQELCKGEEGKDVRVHWGLDLDTVKEGDLEKMYPESERWLAVYRELNSTGIWNSPFTKRLGISMPM